MATVVNVYGTARSGSTMLDLILGNALDAFSCGEVSAWFRPYREHHFKLDCACGQDPCPVWKKMAVVAESQFQAAALSEQRVSFLIDSSKDICWLVDTHRWAHAKGIRTVNVLLWKDPLDLAYSFLKRSNGPTDWRTQFVTCYTRFFDTGLPFRSVNYTELVSNPQRVVAQICGVVGMPYFLGKERFWEKEHHYLFGSAGIRMQIRAKASVMEAPSDYAAQFAANSERLQALVAGDQTLQRILQILREATVSSPGAGDDRSQPPLLRRPLPLWYYKSRALRAIRRYLPERYDPATP